MEAQMGTKHLSPCAHNTSVLEIGEFSKITAIVVLGKAFRAVKQGLAVEPAHLIGDLVRRADLL